MAKFLNDFSSKMNKQPKEELQSLEKVFSTTIALVDKALDGRAFRPSRPLNAAVFDGVMTGLAQRIATGNEPPPEAVAMAYDALLASAEFKKAWERATADEDNVKTRLRLGREAFAGI